MRRGQNAKELNTKKQPNETATARNRALSRSSTVAERLSECSPNSATRETRYEVTVEIRAVAPQETRNRDLPYNPTIPGHRPRTLYILTEKTSAHPCSLLLYPQQPRRPSVDEGVRKMRYLDTMETYSTVRRSEICRKMEGPGSETTQPGMTDSTCSYICTALTWR